MSQSTYEILINLAAAIVLTSVSVVIVAACNALWQLQGDRFLDNTGEYTWQVIV